MNLLKSLHHVPVKLRNPETLDYRNRVLANGGTISEASLDAIEKFVQDCKNSLLWSRLLEVGPFAGSNLNAALVKLIYPAGSSSSLTNLNFVSGDYAENAGLLGDGATKYLNTGFNAQALLPDNAHYSFYLREDVSASGNRSLLGALNGSDQYWLGALTPSTATVGRLGGTLTATLSQPLNKAHYILSRLAANDLRLFKNGALSAADSVAVTHNKPSLNIYVFGFNSASSPGALLPARGGFYSIGHSLTDAQAAAFYQAVQTLQRNLNRAI